jgi:hypothetical protein
VRRGEAQAPLKLGVYEDVVRFCVKIKRLRSTIGRTRIVSLLKDSRVPVTAKIESYKEIELRTYQQRGVESGDHEQRSKRGR